VGDKHASLRKEFLMRVQFFRKGPDISGEVVNSIGQRQGGKIVFVNGYRPERLVTWRGLLPTEGSSTWNCTLVRDTKPNERKGAYLVSLDSRDEEEAAEQKARETQRWWGEPVFLRTMEIFGYSSSRTDYYPVPEGFEKDTFYYPVLLKQGENVSAPAIREHGLDWSRRMADHRVHGIIPKTAEDGVWYYNGEKWLHAMPVVVHITSFSGTPGAGLGDVIKTSRYVVGAKLDGGGGGLVPAYDTWYVSIFTFVQSRNMTEELKKDLPIVEDCHLEVYSFFSSGEWEDWVYATSRRIVGWPEWFPTTSEQIAGYSPVFVRSYGGEQFEIESADAEEFPAKVIVYKGGFLSQGMGGMETMTHQEPTEFTIVGRNGEVFQIQEDYDSPDDPRWMTMLRLLEKSKRLKYHDQQVLKGFRISRPVPQRI